VSWAVLVGGFGCGLIGGASILWNVGGFPSQSLPEAATTTPAPQFEPPSVPATSVQQTNSVQGDSNQLQSEIEGLRQQLEAEKLKSEVSRLRNELAAVKNSAHDRESHAPARESAAPQPAKSTPKPASSGQNSGAATFAYWNALNDIIVREASMRSAPDSGLSAANAGDFLSRRVEAGRFASSEIRRLDKSAVDPSVTRLGSQLAVWYDDNVKVAQAGGNLLGADAASRQGQAGKHYQADERSLQRDVTTINREAEQIRRKMSQKYGLDFPQLQ